MMLTGMWIGSAIGFLLGCAWMAATEGRRMDRAIREWQDAELQRLASQLSLRGRELLKRERRTAP